MVSSCACFWKTPVIFSDGSVYACPYSIDSLKSNPYSINFSDFIKLGQVVPEKIGLIEVLNGPINQRLKNLSLNNRLNAIPRCNKCVFGVCTSNSLNSFSPEELKQIKRNPSACIGGLLSIEINSTCNLKCIMCNRGNYDKINLGPMDIDMFKFIIKNIERNLFYFDSIQLFFNGEPLLHPYFDKLIDFLREKNVNNQLFRNVIIDTNGQFLTPRISQKIIKLGRVSITFSLDAFSKTTYDKIRRGGDFERVISNIKFFLKNQVKVYNHHSLFSKLQFIIMEENQHEVSQFARFWSEYLHSLKVDFSVVNINNANKYPKPVMILFKFLSSGGKQEEQCYKTGMTEKEAEIFMYKILLKNNLIPKAEMESVANLVRNSGSCSYNIQANKS